MDHQNHAHEHSDNQSHTHLHDHAEKHNTCISVVPIFNHLEENQRKEIAKVMHTISYRKGEIIYKAGDDSDSLYIVSSGKVKIYRLSESGKEQLIRILHVGEFTGELAVFSESIHEAYAEAMVPVEVCTMRHSDLQELLIKYPSISLKLLSEFSNRLGEAEKQTTRFATEKVDTRIALFLAECMEDEKAGEFPLPMTKKNLASYLGTTPETISRKLYELEANGLIRQKSHNRIKILNLEGLLLV